MSFFRNMKLGTKILTGFSAVLVMLSMTILVGYLGFTQNSKDFKRYEMIAEHNVLASRIQTVLLNIRLQFKSYISSGELQYKLNLEKNIREMEDLIREAKENMDDGERLDKMKAIEAHVQKYYEGVEKVVEYDRQKNKIMTELLGVKGQEMQHSLSRIMESAFADQDYQASYGAGQALSHLLSARLSARRFLENGDNKEIANVQKQMLELEQWFEYLNKELDQYQRRDILKTVIIDKQIYMTNFMDMVVLMQDRQRTIEGLDEIGPIISALSEQIKESIIKEQSTFAPKVRQSNNNALVKMLTMSLIAVGISILIGLWIKNIVLYPVRTVTDTFRNIAEEDIDLSVRLKVVSRDEMGQMAHWFNQFMGKLHILMEEKEKQSWLRMGQGELNDHLRGEQDLDTLYKTVIQLVAKKVNAQIGAVYKIDENSQLRIMGSYAYTKRKQLSEKFSIGEGIIGQSVLEKKMIILTDVPEEYTPICSGTGQIAPKNIMVVPCIYNGEVKCVLELGTLHAMEDIHIEFIQLIGESIAITLHSAEIRTKMKVLLEKSLQQTEELQAQQEELRQNNDELEKQARSLRESESMLQAQQEELRSTNEELEERTKELEKQKDQLHQKSLGLEKTKEEVEQKARELEAANQYKSEFLANMSHELRTPLNSILILSQLLSEKKEAAPLTAKQMEFAKTIHSSGQDLLSLINDILDLSKVEAGKMDIHVEEIPITEFTGRMERSFRPIAEGKNLDFTIEVESGLPEVLFTDGQRMEQVMRNLLSNALKFTEKGQITIKIARPEREKIFCNPILNRDHTIGIFISDTGIGIPEDKQQVIFEAFQQCDGTTSRRYGGTGLGLSISRELIKLLGGEIQMESKQGIGSTFVMYIPERLTVLEEESHVHIAQIPVSTVKHTQRLEVDAGASETAATAPQLQQKSILIVEDNTDFSKVLVNVAEEKGFICYEAKNGEEGVRMAEQHKPSAIFLDIGLPGMNGWQVMDQLKSKDTTSSIPIHIISALEQRVDETDKEISGYLKKPVDIEKLESVLGKLAGKANLFLHAMSAREERLKTSDVKKQDEKENLYSAKKILIIDDDMRNVFALSSILEQKNMNVIAGRTGKEGIDKLNNHPDTALVIMDVMMPEMDGYEAMKQIRSNPKYSKLPIIALTAKAMKEDRRKCIDAGANDYLTKPLDTEKLLSLIRVWLYP